MEAQCASIVGDVLSDLILRRVEFHISASLFLEGLWLRAARNKDGVGIWLQFAPDGSIPSDGATT